MTDTTKPATPELYAAIMNIKPSRSAGFEYFSGRTGYVMGHRNALHAAAELVSALTTLHAATPAATDERALFEKMAKRYFVEVKVPRIISVGAAAAGEYADQRWQTAYVFWQAARAQLAAPQAPQWACYITQPGESLGGIALRQLKNESRWREIRDLNASHFPDMGASDYYPVGTTLKLPLSAPASQAPKEGELTEAVAWLKSGECNVGPRSEKAIAVVLAALAAPAPETPAPAPALREPQPDDLLTVAHITYDGSTLTMEIGTLGGFVDMVGEDECEYTVRVAPMKRADFEALGEFDGF